MKKAAIYLIDRLKNIDYILLTAVCLLSAYGLLVVAGTVGKDAPDLSTQIFAFVIGFFVVLAAILVDWQKPVFGTRLSVGRLKITPIPIFLYLLAAALLLINLKFGIGEGNRSWLKLPFYPYHFQPSELVKPIFIITLTAHIRAAGEKISKISQLIPIVLHGASIILLVAAQGDLGSALVFVFIFAVMLFCGGLKLRWFALAGGVVCAAVPLLWSVLRDYQRMRIIYGFDPELDPYGYGYQPLMSRRAIQLAGLLGDGYGRADVGRIPEVENDMIFASLTAQFGYIGAAVCIALYIVIVLRLLTRARKYGKKTVPGMICTGTAAVFIISVALSIWMCIGCIPIIGITLPLVSCGGSSVLSILAMIGLSLGKNSE